MIPPCRYILIFLFLLSLFSCPVQVQSEYYAVIYSANGADSGSVPTDNNSYEMSQVVTVSGNTGNLIRTGYSFLGWSESASAITAEYSAGSTFPMGSANITLYAVWSQNKTYRVTYSASDAESGSVPIDFNAYVESQVVTVLGNTGNLIRTGYSFLGWSERASAITAEYSAGSTFPMGSANITLYAVWSQDKTYKVTYAASNTESGSVPIDSKNYIEGVSVRIMGNVGNLQRESYSFCGWSRIDSIGDVQYYSGDHLTIEEDTTLYAVWTETPGPLDMASVVVPQGGIIFPKGVDDGDIQKQNRSFAIGKTEVTWELWETIYLWATTDRGDGKRSDGGELYSFGSPGSDGYYANLTANPEKHPVTMIKWTYAVVFCNALTEYSNVHEGTSYQCVYTVDSSFLIPIRDCDSSSATIMASTYDFKNGDGSQYAPYFNQDAMGYRLPSSSEWEMAARWYGTETPRRDDIISGNMISELSDGYYWLKGNYAAAAETYHNDERDENPSNGIVDGREANDLVASYAKYYDGGWITHPEYENRTSEVGSFQPNPLGLFDMSGNVMEYCFDRKIMVDPSGFVIDYLLTRDTRGGCFEFEANLLQVGLEYPYIPSFQLISLGFRLCRTIE